MLTSRYPQVAQPCGGLTVCPGTPCCPAERPDQDKTGITFGGFEFHERVAYWKCRRKSHERRETTIYAVSDRDAVKIGIADDLRSRLAVIQTGNPRELELLVSFRGPAKLEKDIHRFFAAERIRGEWFAYSDRLRQFLFDLAEVAKTQAEVDRLLRQQRVIEDQERAAAHRAGLPYLSQGKDE